LRLCPLSHMPAAVSTYHAIMAFTKISHKYNPAPVSLIDNSPAPQSKRGWIPGIHPDKN
jgi:hypothetical protein